MAVITTPVRALCLKAMLKVPLILVSTKNAFPGREDSYAAIDNANYTTPLCWWLERFNEKWWLVFA